LNISDVFAKIFAKIFGGTNEPDEKKRKRHEKCSDDGIVCCCVLLKMSSTRRTSSLSLSSSSTTNEEQFWRQRAQILRNLSCSSSDVSKLVSRLDSVVFGRGNDGEDGGSSCGFVHVKDTEEEIENVRRCFQRTMRRHESVREVEMDLLKRREIESTNGKRGEKESKTTRLLEEIFNENNKVDDISTTQKSSKETKQMKKTKKKEDPLSPEMSLSPDVIADENDANKRKVRRRTPGGEKPSRSPLSNVNDSSSSHHREVSLGKPPRGNVKRARTTGDPFPVVHSKENNESRKSYVCPFESSLG